MLCFSHDGLAPPPAGVPLVYRGGYFDEIRRENSLALPVAGRQTVQ